jgi:hypothetical protein
MPIVPIGPVVSEKKLEMWKVYRRQTTDDGRQVMAIVHLDLWFRWTKNDIPELLSRCKLRNPLPIHFKLCIVIGIDSLMVCILFGEISIFHSRVMRLYSSNCRRFFVCHAVNWEPLRQFTNWQRVPQFTARHTKNCHKITYNLTDRQTDGHWYTIVRAILKTGVSKEKGIL